MILVIETATPACSTALIEAGRAVDERHEEVGRGHAERLVPMIEALLAGRVPDGILVDCGPGSFTGIRVGLAAARGLGIGWGVPVSGYSSLALIAAAVRGQGDELGVAVKGGHGELFVQSFARDPLAALDPLRSLTPAQAAAVIRAERVAGSGAAALVAARAYGQAVAACPRAGDACLLPEALAALPPTPLYGRAPDARPMA
ncbi:MAG TPA: tRNA (adenosine(37)-N6)-threonylcarbamoyltransferase complex dimerization subunit type 1 TsaB [Allosphingosinicella sp.]|nr:tRNA (adenosine(37)-N6)-threonylcarbamoyltransferase complex dimerization subunit type 1 TsaB [Allosphingosinicella sp.]